jgi:Zn-dependent peptidase ImmA (M78 family)/transcriptional regulator with XRE-family HTH domain
MTDTNLSPTPLLLTWSRQESGYAIDKVAKRLGVKVEKVHAWEAGKTSPTLGQLERLAKVLHRPLSLFFQERPPKLSPLAADYRRLPTVDPGHESPEFRLALRQMLARRENALNLHQELDIKVGAFDLRAKLNEDARKVGQRLRAALKLELSHQLGWKDSYQAWNGWRDAAEGIGVLVFQFSKVPLKEVRGLSLLKAPLPVVGVNSREFVESRAFTLLHEIVHLMLAFSDEESSASKEKRSSKQWDAVEGFAEVAASHALLPEEALKQQIQDLGLGKGIWDIDGMRNLARRFKMTPLATATRLRESGYLTWKAYHAWNEGWQAWVNEHPKKPRGFSTPVDLTVGRAGRPFAQLVLEALERNRITAVDASRYLDLKFQHFDKLRDRLVRGREDLANA